MRNVIAQNRGTPWIILNYLQRKFHSGGKKWNIRRRLQLCCWDLLHACFSSICVKRVRIRMIAKLRRISMKFDPCEYLRTFGMRFCDRRKIDNHILYKPKNKLPCYFPILSVRIEKNFPSVLNSWWQQPRGLVHKWYFSHYVRHRHGWWLMCPAIYWGGMKAGPDRATVIEPRIWVGSWNIHYQMSLHSLQYCCLQDGCIRSWNLRHSQEIMCQKIEDKSNDQQSNNSEARTKVPWFSLYPHWVYT